ncbi:DUF7319 domain-containing protein [Natrononativus amylolyticus]|uniref:DUF7319 domain-containing protein n=1 Tax=Natrononativus amylolyticus TaxID=2963434 RepID=UPI0020CC2C44|nr:hypothetical protein [Natrononativus amylolyticus]
MSDASEDSGGDEPVDTVEERAEATGDEAELEELRRRVEEKYDFDDFGPADMAEMTAEEWEVAFDDETWITGEELLERVERELKSRIADRDVFAALEYAVVDGERVLVAYSDTDYAIVYPGGSVEGRGTVVRDVKPTVALCSMDSYDVERPPEDWQLPSPGEIPDSGNELGNWMLQLLAASQLLLGLAAIALWIAQDVRDQLVLGVAGMGFIVIGLILFTMVANARLSEKFQVSAYRERLRSIGLESERRPSFLPIDDEDFEGALGESPHSGPVETDREGLEDRA